MNVGELNEAFEKNRVPSRYYTFRGLGGGECYGLDKIDGQWATYYSERGHKSDVQRYSTEDESCQAMFLLIRQVIQEEENRTITA